MEHQGQCQCSCFIKSGPYFHCFLFRMLQLAPVAVKKNSPLHVTQWYTMQIVCKAISTLQTTVCSVNRVMVCQMQRVSPFKRGIAVPLNGDHSLLCSFFLFFLPFLPDSWSFWLLTNFCLSLELYTISAIILQVWKNTSFFAPDWLRQCSVCVSDDDSSLCQDEIREHTHTPQAHIFGVSCKV